MKIFSSLPAVVQQRLMKSEKGREFLQDTPGSKSSLMQSLSSSKADTQTLLQNLHDKQQQQSKTVSDSALMKDAIPMQANPAQINPLAGVYSRNGNNAITPSSRINQVEKAQMAREIKNQQGQPVDAKLQEKVTALVNEYINMSFLKPMLDQVMKKGDEDYMDDSDDDNTYEILGEHITEKLGQTLLEDGDFLSELKQNMIDTIINRVGR